MDEIGFSDENVKLLVKFLVAKRDNFKRAMYSFGVDQPSFHNLGWRAETEVSSRSIPGCVMMPTLTLDFGLSTYRPVKKEYYDESSDEDESTEREIVKKVIMHRVVQCDIPTLVDMIGCVETALRETKCYQVKKAKKAIAKK